MPEAFCASCPFLSMTVAAKPLTARQASVLTMVARFYHERGYAPSFEEIAAHFGFSSLATVHEHLTNLQRKGWIQRTYGYERSIALTPAAQDWAANHT